MIKCIFATDLHGKINRYKKLFAIIQQEKPDAIFLGGDLLPHFMAKDANYDNFTLDYLFPRLDELKQKLKNQYPAIFLILGNDDPRFEENLFIQESEKGLFYYANQRKIQFKNYQVFGYSFIPPTPFQNKDWEKYDVSRYVDPGCTHPTDGFRSMDPEGNITYQTIQKDLENLTKNDNISNAVFLFHSPPYKTFLDRAALDGKMIDHVPMDVHVGSIAIARFIEEKQPMLTLHGHIHESTRITGHWSQFFNKTVSFNAAHDGPELSIIKFDLENPLNARRFLL
jgi:Icc-related predicted phosphoesterase